MRDASLDEFLPTDEGDEEPDGEAESPEDEAESVGVESEAETGSEAEAEPPVESGDRTGGADDPDAEPAGPPPVADVEPARSTFAWSADGAACAACGEQVTERWEAEVGLVCTDCKEW